MNSKQVKSDRRIGFDFEIWSVFVGRRRIISESLTTNKSDFVRFVNLLDDR